MPPLVVEKTDHQSINAFIQLYAKSSEYFVVLLGNHGDPWFADKIKNGIKGKIKEGLKEKAREDITIDYTIEYILSGMMGILTYWFKQIENMRKEKLVSLIYEILNGNAIQKLDQSMDK